MNLSAQKVLRRINSGHSSHACLCFCAERFPIRLLESVELAQKVFYLLVVRELDHQGAAASAPRLEFDPHAQRCAELVFQRLPMDVLLTCRRSLFSGSDDPRTVDQGIERRDTELFVDDLPPQG